MAEQNGRVIAAYGNRADVEIDHQVILCHTHRNREPVVVGDEVKIVVHDDHAYVDAVLPRQSLLLRGLENGKRKIIASNVTHMAVVTAPPPIFSEFMLDCYLCGCWMQNLSPVLIVNKVDLFQDEQSRADFFERLRTYQHLMPIFKTSLITHDGLDQLASFLTGNRSVLVGASGVGKTSLTAFFCNEELKTQAVSKKGSGKHTTTATSLYPLEENGFLIDSPGVREFSLWPVTLDELHTGFPEFAPHLTGCRFRDCRHDQEPHCALKKAVEEEKISQSRYQSYQTLRRKMGV